MIIGHWNEIFVTTPQKRLGWYENDSEQTLKFVSKIKNLENKNIFIAGAGTSMLNDALLNKCNNLIINDISDEALSIVKKRIGDSSQKIEWLNADISLPLAIEIASIDVWIDRAVLHFLTNEIDIQGYFQNLVAKIKLNGHAIIAVFSLEGSPICAGLNLHRYSIEEIDDRIGDSFKLIQYESYTYINPDGDERPYIYSLFKKIK